MLKNYIIKLRYWADRTAIAAIVGVITATFSSTAFADSCAVIDKDLATHYASMAKHSNYYGDNNWDLFKAATASFYDAVSNYIVSPESMTCELSLASATGVEVQTSKDGRFRILSWDELNGGTMHHFDGLIQYQGTQTDHVLTKAINKQVWEIQTIELPKADGSKRSIYLLFEHGIYTNTAHAEALTMYEIEDNKLLYPNLIQTSSRTTNELGFGYNAHSPNGPIKMPFFRYDTENKIISFPVVIESKEYSYGELTNRWIKYQFQDGLFRKVNS